MIIYLILIPYRILHLITFFNIFQNKVLLFINKNIVFWKLKKPTLIFEPPKVNNLKKKNLMKAKNLY